MKKKLLYIALTLLCAAGFTSCDNNWETPPAVFPDASQYYDNVNTTIAQLKQQYYSSEAKSYQVIGTTASGDDIWIRGRVVSSTEAGNAYKAIFVQDETAAIQVRINSSKVYQIYQYGQEVLINCTGLGIGNYGGLLQIGGEANNGTPGYVEEAVYETHVFANGMADPAKIERTKVTIAELNSILSSPDQVLLWQCRAVSIPEVTIQGGGVLPFADKSSTYNTSRYFGNADGRIILYNSPYATFASDIMPKGEGTVNGVLSYYSGKWQVIINDPDDLEGFVKVEIPEGTVSPEPAGEGTVASPYNVVKALELIKSGNAPAAKVYVKGIVAMVDNIDAANYGNATYYISDTGFMLDALEVYRGYGLNGDKFTAPDALKEGDEVVVYGQIVDYNGTPEFTSGSQLYSLNGSTNGSQTPDTPDTPVEGAIYTGLVSNADGWTFDNILLDPALTYIWQWSDNYSCLKGSSYNQQAYAGEAIAYISVDLTGATAPYAAFEHCYRFGSNAQQDLTFVARVAGTAEWTALTIPNWNDGSSFTFTASGNIDLSAYAGKKVDLGFRYTSTASAAATWEIKNFTVAASK